MRDYDGIINISEPSDDYSLYRMYSSDKNDNSVYIGVTRDVKQRVYKHSQDRKRKEFSHKPLHIWLNKVIDDDERNIIFEVLETELSEINAFDKEIHYIQIYKETGFNVLNLSEGGKGNKGNTPWNKGKVFVSKPIRLNKNSSKRKKVYKYTNDNVLLKEYDSVELAGLGENVSPTSIGEWCRKDKKPRNGFVYSYTELT